MRKIYFRADGNAEIGLGHVIRSCALAEKLSPSFECSFFIRSPSEYLQSEIKKSGCSLTTLEEKGFYEEAADWVETLSGNEIIVLDGYPFDTKYQQIIKQAGCRIVCIDDIHAYHFVADIIINHGTVDLNAYSTETYTKMLVGPKYCLLRTPFIKQKQDPVTSDKAVFLNFGGADKYNLTTKYISEILPCDSVKFIHVVLGNAFKYSAVLKDAIAKEDKSRVMLHNSLTAEQMVGVISQCELAIVPGSTIALECASVGIPLISGYYVDNQMDIDAMLAGLGMSLSKGDFNKTADEINMLIQTALSPDVKKELIQRQSSYFDGRSAERLVAEFQLLAQKSLP